MTAVTPDGDETAGSQPGSLAPFRYPVFRALWFANVLSSFGWLVQGVGAAWLMTLLTDSADMVALVQTAVSLPVMLFSLLAGALADNYDRRRVMLAAQTFMLFVSVALALLAFADLVTPWLLLGLSFLLGCGVAFNNPSWQASVGDIVPKDVLPNAVVLNGAGFNVIRSVAPAVGGFIVAFAGAAMAFVVNAASYFGLIGVLIWWQRREVGPKGSAHRESLGAAMTAGVRYVALSPRISRVLIRGFIWGFTCIIVLALLPVVTRDLVGGSAVTYGALLGAYGIGAVIGAFAAVRLAAKLSREKLVRAMFITFAAGTGIASLSTHAWLTAFAMILTGAAWVTAFSQLNTLVQLSTPRWVVGRALSLYQMSIFAGMAIGSWVWGNAAEALGIATALQLAAAAMLAGALLGVFVPLIANPDSNLDPTNRWREPDVALEIEGRSGPVAVTVEYRVPVAHAEAFQALMQHRRTIRRRNGAATWSLLRDLGDPQRWWERFEVDTWVDYIRLHERTTHEDAETTEKIRALHVGDAPVVTRSLVRDPARSQVHAVKTAD